jgi:hypothetical protein
MAIASITGYRSPVNLGLPRQPLTRDNELFDELTAVYNAIHLLNQYLDRLRTGAEGGGGSEQDPDISAGFTRFFVMPALQPIVTGNIVSPHVGSDGYVNGTLGNGLLAGAVALNTGVALSDAAIGEDVRIGVGPGVIAVPGAVAGQRLWGINSRTTVGAYAGIGALYTVDPGAVAGAVSIPVAVGVANGFAIIGNYVSR